MSKQIKKNIICPGCEDKIATEIWGSINVTLQPELRDKVLNDEIFNWRCPHCGYKAQILYPCLYHDMKNKFMIYFIPDSEKNNMEKSIAKNEFPAIKGVKKRFVSSPNELKEKIVIFEKGLDDKALELTKFALSKVVAKKIDKPVEEGYFCMDDEKSNDIGFAFFTENGEDPYYQSTKISGYDKAKSIVEEFYDNRKQQNLIFEKIDIDWAYKMFKEYKSKK